MDAAPGEDASEAIFFAEKDDVMNIINQVCGEESTWESAWNERRVALESILNRYQEQPLLLAPHMVELVEPCTVCILRILSTLSPEDRSSITQGHQRVLVPQVHVVCKILRLLCKVRGFKHVYKLFPHEVYHFEICLFLLRAQDVNDYDNWETRYVLFLWLTMLSLIPFDICSMDSTLNIQTSTSQQSKLVLDIIQICKGSLADAGPTREAAASCLATLLTRPDMDKLILDDVLNHFCDFLSAHNEKNEDLVSFRLVGVLQCLAQVFKRGHRNNLLPHATVVLGPCLKISLLDNNQTMTRKLVTKLVQWLGLTMLAPRVAAWRYLRGQRSLVNNLDGSPAVAATETVPDEEDEDAAEYDIPNDLEDIVEQLLCSLRDKDTVVRWSAAKGIGRITMRIPREMADDVVGAVLEQFNDADNDLAWHGCCLALAELSRRGLLLPARLGDVVPLITRAIHFDVMRGQHSVGLHVRDAACYVCWAFARAYSAAVMKPHIAELSRAMLLTALFDREINCRRAASAAFQENVGRQGNANFPLGIEIISIADYFSLGSRIQAYSSIAPRIAAMDLGIHESVVQHLHLTKLCHWDSDIRELAAKSLANVVPINPSVCVERMRALVAEGLSTSLYKRHGAVLGLSHMLLAFRCCTVAVAPDVLDSIVQLVPQIDKARLYRGKGGELLRQASCLLIESLAKCNAPIAVKTQVVLVEALNENLKQPHEYIRVSAGHALRQFLHVYFPVKESPSENLQKLTALKYLAGLDTEENVAITRGYSLALGALPMKLAVYPAGRLDTIYESLSKATELDKKIGGEADAETRKNCVESAVELTEKLCCCDQFQATHLLKCFEILFRACTDYNIDKRGDTGSWSRVAGIKGLERILGVYFAYFASYPQDPAAFSLSPYTTAAPSAAVTAAALVSTSYGHGIVTSIDAATNVITVSYPPHSLGHTLQQGVHVELYAGNVSVIAVPSASSAEDSLLGDISTRIPTAAVVPASPFLRGDLVDADKAQELVTNTMRVVLKQLAEKLDAVRDVAGKILERLLRNADPTIGYIIDKKKLLVALEVNHEELQAKEAMKISRSWASPTVAFHFLMLCLEFETYFDAVVAGLVVSVGGLSAAVVKEAADALLKWCRQKKSTKSFRPLERLATCFIGLYDAHPFDDRVIVPLMKTTDMLLKNDIFYFLEVKHHTFAARLLQYVRAEVNKSSDVSKLRLSIELLVLLLGFDDPVRPAALRSLVMLLGHRFPKVRKHASDLLYLQLLSDANAIGPSPSEIEVRGLSGEEGAPSKCGLATTEENLEHANEILMTTAWDNSDLVSVRACREQLGTALGLSIQAAVPVAAKKADATTDELNSYSALVREAGY